MGSRTQWVIKTHANGDAIHLYSHWGGESKFQDTRSAMVAAMPRWSDYAYGARIFISNIIGENWRDETGFGIISGDADEVLFEESYYSSTIDFPEQTVTMGGMSWKFEDFIVAANSHDTLVEEFWGAS